MCSFTPSGQLICVCSRKLIANNAEPCPVRTIKELGIFGMESARGVPVFDSEGTVDSHLDMILQAGGNSERVPLLSAEAEDVDASGPGPMVPEAMANGRETARNPVQKLLSKTSTRYDSHIAEKEEDRALERALSSHPLMCHTDSMALYHKRFKKEKENPIPTSKGKIARVFRSLSFPSTAPEAQQCTLPLAIPAQDEPTQQLDAETARHFMYTPNGNLVPVSGDRRSTAPSLSLTHHESPRKERLSSNRILRFFLRGARSTADREKVPVAPESGQPQFQHPHYNQGSSLRRHSSVNPPVNMEDENVTPISESYHRTEQPQNRRAAKIYRESWVKVYEGSREYLKDFYTEINKHTAGGQKVFCSWGEGVDEMIPHDILVKYVGGENGDGRRLSLPLISWIQNRKGSRESV